MGLAHLDIKVENVLFDNEYNPKLCDFGFSYDAKTRVFERQGTAGYMAPEMYSGFSSKGYEGPLADMFALGVTFFIAVFGIPPFHSTDESDNFYKLFHIF